MKIATNGRRAKAISSLRPGDWVETASGNAYVVLQNSHKLRKVEVWWMHYKDADLRPGVEGNVFSYSSIVEWGGDRFVGRGKKRGWRDKLPRWAKRFIPPYTLP